MSLLPSLGSLAYHSYVSPLFSSQVAINQKKNVRTLGPEPSLLFSPFFPIPLHASSRLFSSHFVTSTLAFPCMSSLVLFLIFLPFPLSRRQRVDDGLLSLSSPRPPTHRIAFPRYIETPYTNHILVSCLIHVSVRPSVQKISRRDYSESAGSRWILQPWNVRMRAREVMKDGSLPTEYEVNYKYVNKEEGEERRVDARSNVWYDRRLHLGLVLVVCQVTGESNFVS